MFGSFMKHKLLFMAAATLSWENYFRLIGLSSNLEWYCIHAVEILNRNIGSDNFGIRLNICCC